MIIYHGSQVVLKNPQFGLGNVKNDYGLGFYCTQDIDLAKEWSCQKNTDGFANEYEIDVSDLSILDLSKSDYSILHWIAILMENRIFTPKTPLGQENLRSLLKEYTIDYSQYDIIYGYRANDSYFSFASDFLENIIPLQSLSSSMMLGELGLQFVLKSQKSFSKLTYIQSHKAEKDLYFKKYQRRDSLARKQYFEGQRLVSVKDAVYIIDILRNPELLHGLEL